MTDWLFVVCVLIGWLVGSLADWLFVVCSVIGCLADCLFLFVCFC
jgi:hypothetical protein